MSRSRARLRAWRARGRLLARAPVLIFRRCRVLAGPRRVQVQATAQLGTHELVQPARDWQVRRLGQAAFGATALFLAQLYLSPAQWFPDTEPLHIAFVLSVAGLGAVVAVRLLSNKPLWMGWRSLMLGTYCAMAVLSPTWSLDWAHSVAGGIEVAKHFLF